MGSEKKFSRQVEPTGCLCRYLFRIDKMSVGTDKNVFGSVFAIKKKNEYNNK